ncbi:MAG: 3-oxoacyl-ACP reductase FabG [Phreatobacter sp.]|uniref:SDR family NAD(P)-dependent oxidoreductase n=1 Tax=Phreatobacter sp. TaxID=1966341 RepID=UPI001A3B10F3|nr:3-oxoacyl-ACP reductase FabG [Phreatobacter sp.]MBL8570256.1 3-oxoacyl-ACP reductase FabG [Phreatobacter sp.]
MNTARTHADTFSLSGRVALVTGSARGIGWGIARGLAEAGAHVVLNDLDPAALETKLAELKAAGLKGSARAFDVTEEAAVTAGIDAAAAAEGRLDILVNNAGIQRRKRFVEFSYDEWRAIINTHLNGSFLCTRAAIPHMEKAGYGRVIMLGSIAVQSPKAQISAYAAAKGGVTSMVKALAIELGPLGITCNAIAPGYTATEFTKVLHTDPAFTAKLMERVPSGRWGQPHDIAPAAVYLASPGAAFVNGSVVTVDGGYLAFG